MAEDRKGPFAAGIRLMSRHWALLCWLFVGNLALAAAGTLPAARRLHILRHSLAGEQLFKGFDLGMFHEVLRLADVNLIHFPYGLHEFTSLSALTMTSCIFAVLFALCMLFVSGGILEVYRRDRWLNTTEFFAASGAFFWRFVRLALISLVLFGILGNGYLSVEKAADYFGDKAVADQVGFVIWLTGVIILILLGLFVRLWLDIAKVRAVAQNEHSMLLNTLKSLDISQRGLGSLLWIYLRISLVAWIATMVAFLIWMKVPPTAIWATFILLELIVLVQLGARLWQMAAVTVWFKDYLAALPVGAMEFTAPEAEEVIQPEPQLTPYPETELPPADD